MSDYRFITTNTLTGRVLSDSLPLVGQSCNKLVNSVGSFSGSLTLSQDVSGPQRAAWLNAVTPWRSILWILQDGQPIWHGPITGLPHTSLTGGNVPIQAATMEEFFKHRLITDILTYTNLDIFEIFRNELLYAVGKSPNGNIAAGTGRYNNSSGFMDTVLYSGVVASITEQASLKAVYDAWNDLVTTYLMEYTLAPAITDSGLLYTQVQLGLPQLGRPYAQTHWQLIIPSYHMQDYGWQWAPTNPANKLIGTGSGTTSSFTSTQVAQGELAAGYPLLEGSASFSGTVNSQAQLDAFTLGSLYPLTILGCLTPTVLGGDGSLPRLRDVVLGDEVMFAGTSDLHPAGAQGQPGVTGRFQITGWTLAFPTGQQAEQVAWQLGPLLHGTVI